MKALVTGGTGFIGGAIVNHLVESGARVTVVDNMVDPATRMCSPAVGVVTLHPMDVQALADFKVKDLDVVFHFAGHYANVLSLKEPLLDVSVNAVGTMAMLEFCRKNGVKKVVYASSSGVYGGMSSAVYSEDMQPTPATPYEVSKYAGELLCDGFCAIYGISLVAPRFFNVYGPGDLPGEHRAVVPNFFADALAGRDLHVTGKEASRDFTYIDDVVKAIFAGLREVEKAQSRLSLIYNVATGREVRIEELAEMILGLTKSPSKVVMEETRFWDNAPRRVGDTRKFRALFPREAAGMRSMEMGLLASVNWYMRVC